MAVDTEAKRWGMMQWASGPSVYSTLFNPDTSGLSEIERATVLKLYGGIAFGDPVEPEPEVEEIQPTGGWLHDPYGEEDRHRKRVAEQIAREAIEQAQQVARRDQSDAKVARAVRRARAKVQEQRGLDPSEVSRLIDQLEAMQRSARTKRIAAVLLLM